MIQIDTGAIAGVRTQECKAFADDGGTMGWDVYRASDTDWFVGYGDLLLMTLKQGAVRPFHYHKQGIDTMAVLAGSARIVLYDMREDSPTKGKVQEILIGVDGPSISFLQVPPLVAHGFQGISEQAVLVDLASMEEQSTTDFFFNDPGSVPYEFK